MTTTDVLPKPKKPFNPRIEVFSAFHIPFERPCNRTIDIDVEKAAACCACTACTACR